MGELYRHACAIDLWQYLGTAPGLALKVEKVGLKGCCHCVKRIKGAIITLLVLSIITIILSFSAKMTSLSSMNEYKYLREKILVEIEIVDQTNRESNEPEPFRFDKFWYEFESFENSVLTVDIVFTAILIAFLILENVIM